MRRAMPTTEQVGQAATSWATGGRSPFFTRAQSFTQLLFLLSTQAPDIICLKAVSGLGTIMW